MSLMTLCDYIRRKTQENHICRINVIIFELIFELM